MRRSTDNKYQRFTATAVRLTRERLAQMEHVVNSVSEYRPGQTFEELAIERCSKYYGKTEAELTGERPVRKTGYELARIILGVEKKVIAEFEKGDVCVRKIRREANGRIKASMSFKQIQFNEIVNEKWEDSYWLRTLTKRFFFVIFQKDDNGELRLQKVKFWAMPVRDLEVARKFWEDTKKKIQQDDFEHFINASDDRICHVRPKARDSWDLMPTPSGRMEKKMCYWLNASYIRKIIE